LTALWLGAYLRLDYNLMLRNGALMPDRSRNQTLDLNQLAKLIVDTSTGEAPVPGQVAAAREKNPAAVALGSLGGKKGGKARATKLTTEQRHEIAQKAAKARWQKESD
jgi:hypothetical protein